MTIGSFWNRQSPFLILISLSAILLGQFLTYLEISERNPSVLSAIENRAIIQQDLIEELESRKSLKAVSSFIDDYLQDVRRDGLAAHATTKLKLDQLAANTEALLALLDAYPPAAEPGQLKKSADDFRSYANVWLDRKNHIMDLYLLGGNFPPGEPEFPKELIQALKQSE